MTTDITELAQREKFEAWAEEVGAQPWGYLKKQRNPSGGYSVQIYTYMWAAWKAAGAELVEALEKAQADGSEYAASERAEAVKNVALQDEIYGLKSRIAELESRTVTAAAADVLAERQRQVTAEGWTAERDDGYQNSELADAAACYAIHAHNQGFSTPAHWPWSQDWWKQTSPRRDLVKAGALILAEIERLDRAAGIKVEAE